LSLLNVRWPARYNATHNILRGAQGDNNIEQECVTYCHLYYQTRRWCQAFLHFAERSIARHGAPPVPSFPRRRESAPQTIGNAPPTDSIPAFAGMTRSPTNIRKRSVIENPGCRVPHIEENPI